MGRILASNEKTERTREFFQTFHYSKKNTEHTEIFCKISSTLIKLNNNNFIKEITISFPTFKTRSYSN